MSEALRRRAQALTVADLVDAAEQPRVVLGLVRLAGEGTMAGWARTARAVPNDASAVHTAVTSASPGEVLVVDYGGPRTVSGIGSLVTAEAKRRGAAGVVLWGSARDAAELRALGLHVFATGLHPVAGRHDDAGDQGVEIEIGGVRVVPGDLMVADDDGVAVLARDGLEEVVAAAERARELDAVLAGRLAAGTPLHDIPELREYLTAVDGVSVRRGDG